MKLQNPDDIYDWKTDQLYKAFLEVIETTGRYKKELEKVKKGIKMMIPIYYIADEMVDLDYKNHEANIPHFGTYDMADYKTEVELRETMMRTIIAEEIDNPENIEID